MRLGRKASEGVDDTEAVPDGDVEVASAETETPKTETPKTETPEAEERPQTQAAPTDGPWDVSDLDSVEGYLDFGALLAPVADVELRLNVDEASGRLMSLAWLTDEGGLEVSVFAAPRHRDAWEELRPDLMADAQARGGAVEEASGPYGAEVLCSLPVQLPDGTAATQMTKIFAHQGDRWLLRGALMGRPVVEPEAAVGWYALFGSLVVRRGTNAMPVGEALDLSLPPQARVDVAVEGGGPLSSNQDVEGGAANDG